MGGVIDMDREASRKMLSLAMANVNAKYDGIQVETIETLKAPIPALIGTVSRTLYVVVYSTVPVSHQLQRMAMLLKMTMPITGIKTYTERLYALAHLPSTMNIPDNGDKSMEISPAMRLPPNKQ
jgi:hypothetical protein